MSRLGWSSLLVAGLLAAAVWLALLARRTPHAAIALAPAGPGPAEEGGCAGPAPPPRDAAFEARVADLVDAERRRNGLPPLVKVAPLTHSARWFARQMAQADYFAADHDTYTRVDGRLVRACGWRDRLGFFYEGWVALAENVAAGQETPEEVVRGWLGSPTHREKILRPGRWETGVGYWDGGTEGHYWVQDFGRRDDGSAGRSAPQRRH